MCSIFPPAWWFIAMLILQQQTGSRLWPPGRLTFRVNGKRAPQHSVNKKYPLKQSSEVEFHVITKGSPKKLGVKPSPQQISHFPPRTPLGTIIGPYVQVQSHFHTTLDIPWALSVSAVLTCLQFAIGCPSKFWPKLRLRYWTELHWPLFL